MPLDDEGNLIAQSPSVSGDVLDENRDMAPPGYGQHVLDQLYVDVDTSGIMTPGPGTPFYCQSRAGSSEHLAGIAHGPVITPAALSSRLQSVSLDESRSGRFHSPHDYGSDVTTLHQVRDGEPFSDSSTVQSPQLSRRTSEEEHPQRSGHGTPPGHYEFPSMEQLSKVPSYATATKMHIPRTLAFTQTPALPDYDTAMSAPGSPTRTPTDPMESIAESPGMALPDSGFSRPRSASHSSANRSHVLGFSFWSSHSAVGGHDGERRLRLLQHRSD